MKLSEQQIRRLVQEIVIKEAKQKDLPAHFGGGKNITVFGYKTKHFDICLSAVNLFEDLKKKLKGVNLDGIKDMVAKAAKLSDQIFGLEKRVVKRDSATKKECDKARELNDQLMMCLKKILGKDTGKKTGYMKMHIREITKRKEK